MVESPLVMVVAKDEVVMALEDSVAEPLSVAEPEAEPEAEPVAEGVPDCGCVSLQVCSLWTGSRTYDNGGRNGDTSGCLSRGRKKSVFGPVWRVICTSGAQRITYTGSSSHRTKRQRSRRQYRKPAERSRADQS